VRPLAALVLFVCAIVATAAFAEDASLQPSPQPLTRADCSVAAGWSWNESANVCQSSGELAAASPVGQPLTRSDCDAAGLWWNGKANVCGVSANAQPLARGDCDLAGLSWNRKANVCGERAEITSAAGGFPTANPSPSSILINIDKSTQEMSVLVDGTERYRWPVSTGRPTYFTPSGSYKATSMNEIWYSKEWDNAPMPHAIFFMTDGHAIHGSLDVRHLGKPASHGCVRVSPQNAALLYDLVSKTGMDKTQVVLTGTTPGGEGSVVTTKVKPKARSFYRQPPQTVELEPQPQRRGGFFRRLFGGQ
jgi:hypothetical protein